MSADTVISARGLDKRYGRFQALSGLDLEVVAGEVHGFLGPNGAGKSTAIRILLGLTRASSGAAEVFGRDAWSHAVAIHRRLASVPGDVDLWPGLTGGEAIDLLARLRGVRTGDRSYRVERQRLCEVFRLDPRRRGRHYSKGNRQKVALVAAFAVPAELYILDEPTSGLDPLMEAVFREEIDRVRRDGAAVLLSSHILSEVEQLCDRVSIIRDGTIVDSGTLAQLRHLTRTEVSFAADGDAPAALGRLPGVGDLAVAGGRASFTIDSDRVTGVLPQLARLEISDLQIAPPTLETLFLHHYAETGGEKR